LWFSSVNLGKFWHSTLKNTSLSLPYPSQFIICNHRIILRYTTFAVDTAMFIYIAQKKTNGQIFHRPRTQALHGKLWRLNVN